MAEIKSALEIALARTEGMEADKGKLKEKELRIEGRKAALSFLDGKTTGKEFSKLCKQHKGDELTAFKAGAAGSFMSLLKLPSDDSFKNEFNLAAEGLGVLSGESKNIEQMFGQLSQFFDQYLQNLEQMEKQLYAHYEPVLKQKEEAIFAQTGSRISIDPLDDPEFQKIYSQNIDNLKKNYVEALEQAKTQLKEFIGLNE